MNIKPQIIQQNGEPAFVVLPFAEWERIVDLMEDFEDEAAVRAFREHGSEAYPAEIIHAILDGANPVKAFREWRGLTQARLADAAGIAKLYLSQIETGRRTGSAWVLCALARGLKVDLELLVKEPEAEGAKPATATKTRRRAGRRARP